MILKTIEIGDIVLGEVTVSTRRTKMKSDDIFDRCDQIVAERALKEGQTYDANRLYFTLLGMLDRGEKTEAELEEWCRTAPFASARKSKPRGYC